MKLLIINGPNLNLLGRREPSVYGSRDFESYFEELRERFADHTIEYRQSNVEGEIINILHEADGGSGKISMPACPDVKDFDGNSGKNPGRNSVRSAELSGHNSVGFDGIILNAGGYTHTSVAIADAVAAIGVPVVEVHISNIMAREDYRRISLLAAVCRGSVSGFGLDSYRLAIESFID